MPPPWPMGMTFMVRSHSSFDRFVRAQNFSTSASLRYIWSPRLPTGRLVVGNLD